MKTFIDNQPILSFISNGNGMKKKKDSDQHILQAIHYTTSVADPDPSDPNHYMPDSDPKPLDGK